MPNAVKPIIYIPPLSPLGQMFLGELAGTYVLIYTITQANDLTNQSNLAIIAVSFTVVALVFALAHHRCGNMNPAMCFGLFMMRRMTGIEALTQIAGQIIGGMGGALTSFAFMGGTDFPVCVPSTHDAGGIAKAFVAEFIGTTMLMSVTHASGITRSKMDFFGLPVGSVVLGQAIANGRWSGAAFNPIVATSLQLVKCIGGACTHLKWLPMYISAELLGCVVSNAIFGLLNDTEGGCGGDDNDDNSSTSDGNCCVDEQEKNVSLPNREQSAAVSDGSTSRMFFAGSNSKMVNEE